MARITKLVLHGFKSFAKQTELIFGSRFNCVLGPNGSGKSNILDALCFVLGRSSSKSLRAEKSANLIYNGGKTKQPSKFAEVSIFLSNTNHLFPFDNPEIKITRIVKPTGQSIYRLNDKTRTRQEVVDMLAMAKIEPEGYNIILQGDIIKFVEMSSNERRGLIEEMSGIGIYESKKQKAMHELEKVEEKLREADIILNERKSYLKDLKKDRDQAIKYKDVMSRINSTKATLLNIQKNKKEKEKNQLDTRILNQQEKLKKLNDKINSLRELISKKKAEIDSINDEIEKKGEKEQLEVHKAVEKLRINLATAHSKIDSYNSEISKVDARRKQLTDNLKELNSKVKECQKEDRHIEAKIGRLKKEESLIVEKIASFKKKHDLDGIADIEQQIDVLDHHSDESQQSIQHLREEQQGLLRTKDKLEFQLQAIDEKIGKVLSLEKEQKSQIDKLKQTRTEFKKATLELNTFLNNDSSLAAQLGEARKKLLKYQEDLAKLNAHNLSIQESVFGNIALKKILAQKGNIAGIEGVVSDIGEVKKDYALALEVAAGGKIKGVVVDTDKTAAKCIRYLKDHRFGVSTFFPLNKVRPRKKPENIDKLLRQPGVIGMAEGLIKYDSKYKNVFSFIFGDALVVESIDVARAIGIGKVKMVTLSGDIAEVSGAMQGGYRQRRSSGLGFKEKEMIDEIKELERKISDSQSVIKLLQKKKEDNEEKLSTLRKLKANLEGDIITMEKSLHLESGDMDINKKLKGEISQKIRGTEKAINDVGIKISGVNSELAKNRIKRQELREKINALRNPTLIAELNAFEEKKKETADALLMLDGEKKSLASQLDSFIMPDIENISRVIKQNDKEKEDFKQIIIKLKEQIKNDELELKEKERREKEFYEKFKDLFNRRTKCDEFIKDKELILNEVSVSARDVEVKLNTLSLEQARISTEMLGMQKELEQYSGVSLIKNRSEDELKKEIKSSESFIERIGNVNMRALEIYEIVEKEYDELMNKKDKLHLEKDDVLVMMNEIETKKKELFMKTFNAVNENFKVIFSALLTKGEAGLILENKESPFDGGVLVRVRLTGKKFLDIRSLSGGEKTLTALALIFAIQEHDPATFYVLDEVDAALDKRNSEKLAMLVKKYSERAQYIMISHNDSIISGAETLYGISMNEHGISQVVSLKI